MKKLKILLSLIFLISNQSRICAIVVRSDTTTLKAEIFELKKENQGLKDVVGSLSKDIEATKKNTPVKEAILSFGQWLIVWMPVLLFLLLFVYFMIRLRQEKFKLSEALSSCEPREVSTSNDPTVKEVKLIPSSSRLIAFMSGLEAIVISTTLMTFYYYDIIAKVGDPQSSYLDSAWKVIAGLGIGVIPYGFNMLKEAQKT
jgi:hypothetical protein